MGKNYFVYLSFYSNIIFNMSYIICNANNNAFYKHFNETGVIYIINFNFGTFVPNLLSHVQ